MSHDLDKTQIPDTIDNSRKESASSLKDGSQLNISDILLSQHYPYITQFLVRPLQIPFINSATGRPDGRKTRYIRTYPDVTGFVGEMKQWTGPDGRFSRLIALLMAMLLFLL